MVKLPIVFDFFSQPSGFTMPDGLWRAAKMKWILEEMKKRNALERLIPPPPLFMRREFIHPT